MPLLLEIGWNGWEISSHLFCIINWDMGNSIDSDEQVSVTKMFNSKQIIGSYSN